MASIRDTRVIHQRNSWIKCSRQIAAFRSDLVTIDVQYSTGRVNGFFGKSSIAEIIVNNYYNYIGEYACHLSS